MNKRIKKLWIKALRSGRYLQGKGALHPNGAFCCLGVLCDVYRKETGDGEWSKPSSDSDYSKFVTSDNSEIVELPLSVIEWAGLDQAIPRLGPRSNSAYASTLNDRGKSFDYIADRIEKYL